MMKICGLFSTSLVLAALATPALASPESKSYESLKSWAEEQATSMTPARVTVDKDYRTLASPPGVRWENAKISFNVDSNSVRNSYTAQVNQILSWSEMESFTNVRFEYVDRLQDSTCYKMVCSGGTGKSEAWNAFYSAPKDQKPKALSGAIKGIGDSTAKKLVDSGYFKSKPRSWEEFASEINRAAGQGIIQKGAATDILNTYRGENASNLGYNNQSCSEQAYTCQQWVSVLVPVPFTDQRSVDKQKISDTRQFDVEVEVKGALLLPFEKDPMQFEINENGEVLGKDRAGELNRYSVESKKDGNDVTIIATAQGRNLIDFPQRAIARDIFTPTNRVPTFAVELNPSYVPAAEDPNAQVVVDYTVFTCARGFLGICGAWKPFRTAQATFTGPRAIVAFTDLPRKSKAYISYTVTRRNGLFFNNKSTQLRSTDQVRLD